MNNTHKSGAGRKPLKPDYDAVAILHEQMQAAVALYNSNNSLQTIADTLSLNPIKVRKLLITAGVYESETADAVNSAFEAKQGIPYKEALEAVAAELNLSKASVTSYLPYKKGVYFREDCDRDQVSVGAERLRRMRQRQKAVEALQSSHDEQPNKGIQLMWCVLLILLPIALLFAESSMNNLQSVSIVAAFPIGAVIVMITVSFMKDAKKYMENLEKSAKEKGDK